ncbi:MAG: OmpA family protein [Candidatus Eisenbacteria bacterium]
MSKKPRPEQEEPASWLATFGDLATLLLTFYVLIYASSTYQPGEWETARGAIDRMLGLVAGKSADAIMAASGDGALNGNTGVIPLLASMGGSFGIAAKEAVGGMEEFLGLAGSSRFYGEVEVETAGEGFIFRLAEPVAFAPGSADLIPEAALLLEPIGRIIRAGPVDVSVDGHTCDLPTRAGRYGSNWQLSGARAASVVRYLEAEGLGEASIVPRARGEFFPLVPNEDEEHRRRNRRVEIRLDFR